MTGGQQVVERRHRIGHAPAFVPLRQVIVGGGVDEDEIGDLLDGRRRQQARHGKEAVLVAQWGRVGAAFCQIALVERSALQNVQVIDRRRGSRCLDRGVGPLDIDGELQIHGIAVDALQPLQGVAHQADEGRITRQAVEGYHEVVARLGHGPRWHGHKAVAHVALGYQR